MECGLEVDPAAHKGSVCSTTAVEANISCCTWAPALTVGWQLATATLWPSAFCHQFKVLYSSPRLLKSKKYQTSIGLES